MSSSMNMPWLEKYGHIPHHLEYPDLSMYDFLEKSAKEGGWLDIKAYDFQGNHITYREFLADIDRCAKALRAIGIKEGDVVTICMPNTPQAITMFYALNLIGAVSSMVHPLSSEGEIEYYLNYSESVAVLTMDMFYGKFKNLEGKIPGVKTIIAASIKEALPAVKKQLFSMTKGRKIAPLPKKAGLIRYSEFMKKGDTYIGEYIADKRGNDVASILYSGGTTGTSKGILLTNMNFNALSMQTAAAGDCIIVGHIMLSIMPVFHGFGLGIGIHTGLTNGCTCVLVPQFNADIYADILRKYRPNYIAGVPTLFQALLKSKKMENLDLSCLEGVFSGGDSLSVELKKKVDAFIKERGAKVQIREGFGTTECVTASCLTPKDYYKEGSIGIPFPDTIYKIAEVGSEKEVPYGTEGEICISGPTVMKGYLKNPEETAHTLRIHEDGRTWLHTGDLGIMDEEGFIYYKQRIKRMIISSGYNVYPSQLENVIDQHPDVLMSCCIGVPDEYKIQKVKAFVVLKPGVTLNSKIKNDIKKHCEKNIAKYAMPYEFEFRDSLPQTLVGKVAYRILEEEEAEKAAKAKKEAELEAELAKVKEERKKEAKNK